MCFIMNSFKHVWGVPVQKGPNLNMSHHHIPLFNCIHYFDIFCAKDNVLTIIYCYSTLPTTSTASTGLSFFAWKTMFPPPYTAIPLYPLCPLCPPHKRSSVKWCEFRILPNGGGGQLSNPKFIDLVETDQGEWKELSSVWKLLGFFMPKYAFSHIIETFFWCI